METPRTPAPVEVGVLSGKTIGEQAEWYSESLGYGQIDDKGHVDVYGVYIAGMDTPICHTGNGPTSKANADFIAKCFNEYDALERSLIEHKALLEQARANERRLRELVAAMAREGRASLKRNEEQGKNIQKWIDRFDAALADEGGET